MPPAWPTYRMSNMETRTKPKRGADFWEYVDKAGDCWVWTGTRDANGYGRVSAVRYGFSAGPKLAHRIAWFLTHGSLDPNACVLHRCDNPPCVRPEHLFLGTKADNTADMIAKGRGSAGARPWESRTHGTRNANAKLTEELVVELRKRAAGGERFQDLAVDYGISESRANAIINGTGWRHVWPFNGTEPEVRAADARRHVRAERRAAVIAYRQQGMSQSKIAELVGIGQTQVSRDLRHDPTGAQNK